MEDQEQDEPDEQVQDAEPEESTASAIIGSVSASELSQLRSEVAQAGRVMDYTEHAVPDLIGGASQVSEQAWDALRGTTVGEQYMALNEYQVPLISDAVLQTTNNTQSVAESLASDYDASALARMAMPVSMIDSIANSLRLWDAGPPKSALSEMIERVSESTELIYEAPDVTSSLDAISDAVRGTQSLIGASALSNITDSLGVFQQSLAASVVFDEENPSALTRMVNASSIYAKTLFDSTDATSAMSRIARESISGAIGSLIDSTAYANLRSSLYEDATFADLHSLMEQTDLSGLTAMAQHALGNVPLGALEEAAARLRAEDLEPDEFEEAAIEALRETDETFNPDLPPTPEELAATEAFVKLLILLRPDLSDDPGLRNRVRWVSRGGGALVGVYLFLFHQPVFVALGTLLFILGFAKSTGDVTDRLLSPGAHKDDDDDED